jgi:hypothetical protein
MHADADRVSPVDVTSIGQSWAHPVVAPLTATNHTDSDTASPQEPAAVAAPLPPEVDRTPSRLANDPHDWGASPSWLAWGVI